MNAKEFISRAYQLRREVEIKITRLESIRAGAERMTCILGRTQVSGPGPSDPVGKAVLAMEEIREDIAEMLSELAKVEKEIRDAIDLLPSPDYRMVLEKRYLLCQQWRQIASDMKVTVRWAQMLRDGAIQELQRVLDRGK